MVSGISLANKIQLLFGFAAVVILAGALAVPWVITTAVVDEYELEIDRQAARAWLAQRSAKDTSTSPAEAGEGRSGEPRWWVGTAPAELEAMLSIEDAPWPRTALVDLGAVGEAEIEADTAAERDRDFLWSAAELFREEPAQREYIDRVVVADRTIRRYARAIGPGGAPLRTEAGADDSSSTPPARVLLIDRPADFAEKQLVISRAFIAAAGVGGSLLAILVFYFVLTKLILSPVRKLRRTAEKVQQGDLTIRSEIATGDEFQELAQAFNTMLDRVESSQAQLRAMNESLDLKVMTLSEANVGLFESNRFKSDFLANVSHELRTPLNSIIGFAELLDEIARTDVQADPKRLRYIENIITSGRRLLDMINELLDMAKIEAGRMEISIEPTSVGDLIEGLVGIMRPQAESKSIDLSTRIADNVPMVETDPGKLQQILYNFLSNAIKFTPRDGRVEVLAQRIRLGARGVGVRLSVRDNGPGIPADMQEVIFEKFRQIDSPHTKEHPGTGLGLAICRELADMLGAHVSFVSEAGQGTTFSVDLPQTHHPDEPQPLMRV